MRFYSRSESDKINSINRCFFDVQQSRVWLALERLTGLHAEFPNDHHVLYSEGLIRKDCLGQGLEAGRLFQAAFRAGPAQRDETRVLAACNATRFAKDEIAFRQWGQVAAQVAPQDLGLQMLRTKVDIGLRAGLPYREILLNDAKAAADAGNLGTTASLFEIALASAQLQPNLEANVRRVRAETLRRLDVAADGYREALGATFRPEQRLTLKEALAELERALTLDPYDAEMWNLKSAWSWLLDRPAETIAAADRAIELRPHNYANPHVNKANALRKLGRDQEALACAREAVKQAEAGGSDSDKVLARLSLETHSAPWSTPTLQSLEQLLEQIVHAARVLSEKEIGQWKGSIANVERGFAERIALLGQDFHPQYVRMMAELLVFFTPETGHRIVLKACKRSTKVMTYCIHALGHIMANSDYEAPYEAARLVTLLLLADGTSRGIGAAYRELVKDQAWEPDEQGRIDRLLSEELSGIHPDLPHLVTTQSVPISTGNAETETERSLLNAIRRRLPPWPSHK